MAHGEEPTQGALSGSAEEQPNPVLKRAGFARSPVGFLDIDAAAPFQEVEGAHGAEARVMGEVGGVEGGILALVEAPD